MHLNERCTHEEFADAVGVSRPRVSTLVADGVLSPEGTAGEWLLVYCARLREQAAGRGQELTMERAALAREQRIGQEIKNRVALGDYAPVGLLTDVLSAAAAAVSARFDAMPSKLRKALPDLTPEQLAAIEQLHADARAEWVRATAALMEARIDELADELEPDDDEGDELAIVD